MSKPKILLLQGPNLNSLGKRQTEIYGIGTLSELHQRLQTLAGQFGVTLDCVQSNSEIELIEHIQKAQHGTQAIIINPGALTHSSLALLDAILGFSGPTIEVHISNIHRRESFRQHTLTGKGAVGVIAGLGTHGYELALRYLAEQLTKQ